MHLGASPAAGKAYTESRGNEIWNTFERLINICEAERTDLLLIAGDLFHRQPLLRELREVNYLFSKLTHTKVVLIAGNHDYLKNDSFYRRFQWCNQVTMIMQQNMCCVEYPELGTCVYGLSYEQREITEPLYNRAFARKRQPIEILLAHGGDETHIPIVKKDLQDLGYDYVALGHIHKPMELDGVNAYYAGALEPIDKNDTGIHGFVRGEITVLGVKTEFIPFATREYVHLEVNVNESMTGRYLKEKIQNAIMRKGKQHMYKVIVQGSRNVDTEFDFTGMDDLGNILEFVDRTKPSYDYKKIYEENKDNILGKYIEKLQDCLEGTLEYQALMEGISALIETRKG